MSESFEKKSSLKAVRLLKIFHTKVWGIKSVLLARSFSSVFFAGAEKICCKM
jgi:hypothetical protein